VDDPHGTDLAVVPFLIAHDAAAHDLVVRRVAARPGVASSPDTHDLETIAGRRNLAQALLLRLLTPRGSLRDLGHAAYGSRLHELIGQHKTEATRNLCRAHILDVIAQEQRVENTATEITFDPAAETLSSFNVIIAVQPVSGGDPVRLTLEVGL